MAANLKNNVNAPRLQPQQSRDASENSSLSNGTAAIESPGHTALPPNLRNMLGQRDGRSSWVSEMVPVPGSGKVTPPIREGVETKKNARAYFGSASNTTRPATIDVEKLIKATSEGQEIESEDIKKGSARYKLLMPKIDKKIRAAVRTAIQVTGNDFVIEKDGITDARGKPVADITQEVLDEL